MTNHIHMPPMMLFLTLLLVLIGAASAFVAPQQQHGLQQCMRTSSSTSTSSLAFFARASFPAASNDNNVNVGDHDHDSDSSSSSTDSEPLQSSRRTFFRKSAGVSIAAALATVLANPASTIQPAMAAAVDNDEGLMDVYFGCGCFWHVQHEMVAAEKKILGRTDEQLTARAGYAGGKAGSISGKVCYHNAQNIADYGKLGHAEVVSVRIPPSAFKEFCVAYFTLFDKDGNRPDQAGDRGTEYRNLVGFPGGSKGSKELAQILIDASIATGDKLDFAVGKGDDKDLRKVSFLMDTAAFPFFVGEQYHQFHDGFNLNENYPGSYNNLAGTFAKGGESFGSCPNGSLGLGFGGL
jgi:peptide methionine sulfoxide reductase MsrA